MDLFFGGTTEPENQEDAQEDADLTQDIDLEELGITDGVEASKEQVLEDALDDTLDLDELLAEDGLEPAQSSRGKVGRSHTVSFDDPEDDKNGSTDVIDEKSLGIEEVGDKNESPASSTSASPTASRKNIQKESSSSRGMKSRATAVFAKNDEQRKDQLDEIVQMLEDQNAELARIRIDHAEQLQLLRTRHEAICRCLETNGYSVGRRTPKAKPPQDYTNLPGALQRSSGASNSAERSRKVSSEAEDLGNEVTDRRQSQSLKLETVSEEIGANPDDFDTLDAF